MTATLLVSDYMGDLRSWMRTQSDLEALQGARVFFRIPDSPAFPLTRLLDVQTTPQPGQTPIWTSQIAFYIWGGQPSDYATVSNIKTLLLSLLKISGPWLAGTNTVILNVDAGSREIPDPDTGNPRVVVDATITHRRIGPTDRFVTNP